MKKKLFLLLLLVGIITIGGNMRLFSVIDPEPKPGSISIPYTFFLK